MVQYRLIVARGLMFGPLFLRIRQKCTLVTSILRIDSVVGTHWNGRVPVAKAGPVVPEDEVPEGSLPG
jgi:hypothetical protein